jgi:hypothetical protein
VKAIIVAAAFAAVAAPAAAQWAPHITRGQVFLTTANPLLSQRLTVLRRECQDLTPSSPRYDAICGEADDAEKAVTQLGCEVVQDPHAQLTYTWACPRKAVNALRRLGTPQQ